MKPTLISVVGPTAVGKTKLALELARHFKTEIISADSRQCYREMSIGTAKPTRAELQEVKHHFINSHSIHDYFSAGEFERQALTRLKELFRSLEIVVMVGGSGLYVDALTKGLAEIPKIALEIRKRLMERFESDGLSSLYNELKRVDPKYAKVVDRYNQRRIIRALEVYYGTEKAYSSWRNPGNVIRPFTILSIGLEQHREVLYQRIDERMDMMIAAGLFDEAASLHRYRRLNPLQTVGYKEIFEHIEGNYDYEECVRVLKRNSRRYAKRQLTWFKKNDQTEWFDAADSRKVLNRIELMLRSNF
ncbi:MAG: tRNA (adenosine(37)-N6)-dimethylallyltransferase MiaA [Bacteroidota bacterium]